MSPFVKTDVHCSLCGMLLRYRRTQDQGVVLYHQPAKCKDDDMAYIPNDLDLTIVKKPKWIEQ